MHFSLLLTILIPTLLSSSSSSWTFAFDIVNTKKNPLIRLKISLKNRDLGQSAIFGDACNLTLYDQTVRPLYDDSLSIFEASDGLLQWLVKLEKNSASNLRKETCGAHHLMGCIENKCQCLSADPVTFPQYRRMKPVAISDPNDPSIIFHECRMTKGGQCNVRGHLFCDLDTMCVDDERRRERGGRCVCAEFDQNDTSNYVNYNQIKGGQLVDPDQGYGVKVLKIPKNTCNSKPIKRPRAYQ